MKTSRRGFLGVAAATGLASPLAAALRDNVSTDWDSADAVALAQWVANGYATPSELLDEAVRRLEQVNPALNLLAQNHVQYARDQLATSTPTGAFAGVPFLLKDLGNELAGTITSAGSALHGSTVAQVDSVNVQRFKQAGVVIFGKTNTPEFGLALTTEGAHLGDCKNPWSLDHSTGGSSGGSAAAVAAGVVPMAHATDGGGSIRVPANHCGVFGFKPSRGLTAGSRGAGMSVGHIVSRSVRDSALMLELTAGYEPGAPYGIGLAASGFFAATLRAPKPMRIALNLTEPAVVIDPEVRRVVLETAAQLEAMGHRVEEATPGVDYGQLNAAQNVLMCTNMSAWLSRVEQLRGRKILEHELEPMTHMVRAAGDSYSGAERAAALQLMHAVGVRLGEFHRDFDAILQPVTATPAPKLGTIVYQAGDDIERYTERFRKVSAFTHLYNMTGQPSMSLPLGMSNTGLPIGVMLSAAVGNDARLFALAAECERASPWFNQRPPIRAS